jgi:hypothetical protein
MTWYAFHELTLKVTYEGQEPREELDRLLQDLSWVRTAAMGQLPSLRLTIRPHESRLHVPPPVPDVRQRQSFWEVACGDDRDLTDGLSLLHLEAMQGQGIAYLAPAFAEQPALVRRHFWAFGLLKLLRPHGLYGLHAAGVVSRQGQGLLLVGASGCGKSTLALSLIRHGWHYLSDDAVLLRLQTADVEACACRKPFYVNATATAQYADLPVSEEVPDTTGAPRRRVCIDAAFPGQRRVKCRPQVVVFPRIVPHPHSRLQPLDRLSALRHLLTQSGPALFDRRTMPQHLEVLKGLVQQARTYELWAGRDMVQCPSLLIHLLQHAEGEEQWPLS